MMAAAAQRLDSTRPKTSPFQCPKPFTAPSKPSPRSVPSPPKLSSAESAKPKLWEQYQKRAKPQKDQHSITSEEQVEYERVCAEMEQSIKQKQEEIAQLQRFLQTIQSFEEKEIFDSEDTQTVQEELIANQQALQELEESYQEKVSYYQNVLVNMKDLLDKRQFLLEQFDSSENLLKNHPSLMKYFAEKQSNLTLMFREICKSMAQ